MDAQIQSLEKAKELTQNLYWEKDKIIDLEKQFHQLAKYFLYGGDVRVLDRFRIYIKCVEFYFHSEKDNGIKDPIVYHRNNNHVAGELPYFTPFTLHAHASGFDIAFENPKEEYRASVLIRAYEVYDEKETIFLKYKSNYKDIFDVKKQKNVKVDYGKFEEVKDEKYTNTQSTYLYDILNGFGNAGVISWMHIPSQLYNKYENEFLTPIKREGVYEGAKWQGEQYNNERKRLWKFSRKESIKDII